MGPNRMKNAVCAKYEKRAAAQARGPSRKSSGKLHKFQGESLCKSLIFIFGDLHKPRGLFLQSEEEEFIAHPAGFLVMVEIKFRGYLPAFFNYLLDEGVFLPVFVYGDSYVAE